MSRGTLTVPRLALLSALIVALSLIGSLQCEQTLPPRMRFCGGRLPTMMVSICKNRGGLYEPRGRRAGLLDRGDGFDRRIRRSEDSIVEECCRRGCGINDILQYCAEPPVKGEPIDDLSEILAALAREQGLRESGGDGEFNGERPSTTRKPRLGTYQRRPQFVFLDGDDS